MKKILLTTLNSKYVHTNLAIMYIAKSIEKNKNALNQLKTVNREFTINNNIEYIANEIIAGKYDIVCFSCYIWNIEMTSWLCEILKKSNPELKIVLAGPEVSYESEKIIDKMDYIDFIVSGEGEEKMADFLCDIDNYKEKSIVRFEPVSVDNIPFPYDEIPENKIIYYETSRGCPYNCSYCMSSIDKKLRPFPIQRVKQELKYFLDNNVKQVKFLDRTFNYDINRSIEIFEYLIENDNGITNFHFEVCADNLDDKAINVIKKARKDLFQFEIGIQSTNEETLKAVDRTSKTEKILENVEKLVALGNSHIHVDLIAGLPFETLEIFKKSFDDVYRLNADMLQLGFLKLLKGTKIRNEEEIHKYIYNSRAPYQVIKNKYISAEELMLLKRVEEVLDHFHNKGGFAKTVNYMIGHKQSPFEFFYSLSEFYYDNGFQNANHKKEDNYRILNKYLKEYFGEDKKTEYEEVHKLLISDMEIRLNQDAVKKFYKKGWEINGLQF